MHSFLTQRAVHVRPPAGSPTTSGEVTTARSAYSTVTASVPIRIGAKSAFLRQGEEGLTKPADFIGHADKNCDVRVRDVFELGAERYEVQALGNVGTFLRSFDLARVVLT